MKKPFVIMIGIMLTVSGPIFVREGFRLRDMELKAMKGEIIPFEIDPQEPIEVHIGGFHVILTMDELEEGFNLRRYISLGFDYPFKIVLEERKFLTSVEIPNANGQMIAKIVDNQWVVHENKVIARDRNYNAYAFEVINSDLVPVIQVVYTPENKMYLGGFFYVPNGTMLVTPNATIINPLDMDTSEHIEPIFKYPSDEHLGEMVMMEVPKSFIETIFGVRKSNWYIYGGAMVTAMGATFDYYGYRLHKEENEGSGKETTKKRRRRTRH